MVSELGAGITRGTVWIAVACYLWRVFADVRATASAASPGEPTLRLTRTIWSVGLAAYLAHVLAAFGWYHDWSHAAAWQHTAERTTAATGFDSGIGLLFNHALTLVWLIDVAAWYRLGPNFPIEHRLWTRSLHAYFTFMTFNATIVFGPSYWIPVGVAVLAGLTASWWLARR